MQDDFFLKLTELEKLPPTIDEDTYYFFISLHLTIKLLYNFLGFFLCLKLLLLWVSRRCYRIAQNSAARSLQKFKGGVPDIFKRIDTQCVHASKCII